MATIKSFTSLEQSKKLAEILPLESADMCLTFTNNVWNPVWGKAHDIYQLQKDCYEPDYTKDDYVDFDEFEPKVIPCWSLAVLLDVLPDEVGDNHYLTLDKEGNEYCCCYEDINGNSFKHIFADNPVDACVAMIERLHELKIL